MPRCSESALLVQIMLPWVRRSWPHPQTERSLITCPVLMIDSAIKTQAASHGILLLIRQKGGFVQHNCVQLSKQSLGDAQTHVTK